MEMSESSNFSDPFAAACVSDLHCQKYGSEKNDTVSTPAGSGLGPAPRLGG